MKSIIIRLPRIAVIALAAIIGMLPARAFDTDTYTSGSVLAQGHWVKISVTETGVHFIPASSLRSWGFSDPSKVKVYGYGGAPISNTLSKANYVDDLPQVQSHATASGVYFYAVGINTLTAAGSYYTYTLNPHSNEGYYFLTADGDPEVSPARVESEGSLNTQAQPVTTFNCPIQHEKDLVTISQSGLSFLGEDFRYNQSQAFDFQLIDHVESTPVWTRTVFVANSGAAGNLGISFNSEPAQGATAIKATPDDDYGVRVSATKTYEPKGSIANLSVGVAYQPKGVVQAAHLDYIAVNYERHLRMPSRSQLLFQLKSTTAAIGGADPTAVKVWDVTSPRNIIGMNLSASASGAAFTNPYSGSRSYVAWSESMSLPQPKYVSTVANQNLHGYDQSPDMVIFTTRQFQAEANRLAAIHTAAPDNMNVLVVVQELAFNEFASGSPDPGAFRKMLKMFYDRGIESGHPLRYVLFFGRPTFDNRNITGLIPTDKEPVMPTWQTDESIIESGSYTSDDIFAMLADNSGSQLGSSRLCIAVGRIPARNVNQARTYVDKLIAYNNNKLYSQWKNSVLLMADNGNDGVFMNHSEDFQSELNATENGSRLVYNKVYIDAFNIQNGVCAQGRERFRRLIQDGVMWWNYVGHGSLNLLSAENICTNADINNMYNKHWPVFFGATCSFSHWDGTALSGSEILAFNPDGGVIASICPTRKARIPDNGILAKAMGTYLLNTDVNGNAMTVGESFTATKNSMLSASSSASTNKLRYTLLGDPAMRLTLPDNVLSLSTINGENVDPESQITIMARQRVIFSGQVLGSDGQPMPDFNGTLSVALYDAEYSTTSQGKPANGTSGQPVTFEEMGSKLYAGTGVVKDGVFTAVVEMPSDVSDNFRPATLSMYAVADDGRQAAGANRDFYVYGYDYEADADDTPPVIEYAYLNHKSFTPGGIVNEEPTFIARVSDDVAINMSVAGIGHQMTIKLDDRRTYSDVPMYFSPSTDGTPSGTVVYPLGEISEGNHTLAFRVWDAAGNSTTHLLEFYVQPGAAPEIFDIYPDASPATDRANFYITHNRPDAQMSVSLDIYDMGGRHVWTSTQTSRSDLWLSSPITWNLCDFSGRRVPRGIYLYKATVKIDGTEISTPAKRIAVTAP